MAGDRGHYVEQANDKEGKAYDLFEPSGLAKQPRPRPPGSVKPPKVAYIEVDGVVPMTRELDPRRSSPVQGARGGKGRRYELVGREVENAMLVRRRGLCSNHGFARQCAGCVRKSTCMWTTSGSSITHHTFCYYGGVDDDMPN